MNYTHKKQKIPRFNTTPARYWPFKKLLNDVVLVRCFFNKSRYADDEFNAFGIEPPINILEASIKRRAEFLAGRLCAVTALRIFGSEAKSPASGSSRQPIWCSDIVGSITHTDTAAAALVGSSSRYLGVGIDCEVLVDDSVHKNLRDEVLTLRERELYERLADDDQSLFFTTVFSAKESLFKALFSSVGFYFDFHDAEVTEFDVVTGVIRIRLLTTLAKRLSSGVIIEGLCCRTAKCVITLIAVEREFTN